jgi:hypothetical protein
MRQLSLWKHSACDSLVDVGFYKKGLPLLWVALQGFKDSPFPIDDTPLFYISEILFSTQLDP